MNDTATKNEVKHTPTPWEVESYRLNGPYKFGIGNGAGTVVVSNLVPLAETDAAFIVRAVNAHDDLVKALKDAAGRCAYLHGALPNSVEPHRCDTCKPWHDVIAKAEGR